MTVPAWGPPAALGVGLATLVFWNFGVGTRLASLAGAGRAFRLLSSLSAFLFLPALVIALLASSAAGARVLGPLAWLWPLTAVAMTGQAAWAMVGGGRGALGALPLLALNVLVAWAAAVRWIESLGGVLAPWTFAPGMAVATVLTAGAGATTYPWIAAVLVPALAPATPARSRRTRAARVAVTLVCAALLTATGFAFPSALDSLRAASTLRTNAPAPREGDELAVGLRVFGTLSGAPSGALARQDLSLADSIGATALHLEFSADGATTAALDSVARALEARRDSVRLIVTLDLGSTLARGRGSDGARQQRMALIERVVRRLRPDVLVPAARTALSGNADLTWWQTYYGQVAATVRRANRSVAVALPVTSASAVDSTLAEWVLQGSSELAALAVTAQTADTPRQFAATLHAVARWASFARDAPMVWVLGTPSAPAATGEVVHQRVVRFALDWSAAHPWVRGVIAGDASDGLTPVGLRTATGRPRRALEEVRTVLRLRRDMPPALIDPRAAPSPDTTPAPTVRSPTDSLPVPSP